MKTKEQGYILWYSHTRRIGIIIVRETLQRYFFHQGLIIHGPEVLKQDSEVSFVPDFGPQKLNPSKLPVARQIVVIERPEGSDDQEIR